MRGGKRAGLTTVAHGGSAAENAAEDPDDVVDYVVSDLRELLAVVGVV
jgi:beta-phosphoglucomutase-like phosphatase (HAD superfamily)